jgi:glycosyltransferase involved in cell wall biosynthesis
MQNRKMRNNKIEISVIIPTFNSEKYIGRCIRSLLKQSLSESLYEIIVIDDGSTDRTNFAIDIFHDAIVPLYNSKNIGLPASLNKGINRANGKYIVRVDSDDYVNENFLNFLHCFLEQNKEYDAVACDYWLVDDAESWIKKINCMEKPIGCGILFKREDVLSAGLYNELFRCHEEREFRIRYEKLFKIERLALPLYRYRKHQNNMTNDNILLNQYEELLNDAHGKKELND